jgi:hypothetical protein
MAIVRGGVIRYKSSSLRHEVEKPHHENVSAA